MPKTQVFAFTSRYNRLSNVLINDCGIYSLLENPGQTDPGSLAPKFYKAIWDTGATNTSITQKVASECGLMPIGTARVHHAQGVETVDVFLASILLPNRIVIPEITVTKANLIGADMLIGMDIIGRGDFAVSNFNGSTRFSFRMPSLVHFDLGDISQRGKSGRNKRRKK